MKWAVEIISTHRQLLPMHFPWDILSSSSYNRPWSLSFYSTLTQGIIQRLVHFIPSEHFAFTRLCCPKLIRGYSYSCLVLKAGAFSRSTKKVAACCSHCSFYSLHFKKSFKKFKPYMKAIKDKINWYMQYLIFHKDTQLEWNLKEKRLWKYSKNEGAWLAQSVEYAALILGLWVCVPHWA